MAKTTRRKVQADPVGQTAMLEVTEKRIYTIDRLLAEDVRRLAPLVQDGDEDAKAEMDELLGSCDEQDSPEILAVKLLK